MDIVIHHNPDCGTSRNVLAMIEAAGYAPTLIEYLKTGWTKPQLLGLFAAAGLTPRTALRETKSPAAELGLLEEGLSGEAILDAMVKHPILVNRPIVCTAQGVRLCRPSEVVLDLLDRLPPGPFRKEDGTLLIDDQGRLAAPVESEEGLDTEQNARAILKSRQDAVDDLRAGRPARYFLAAPSLPEAERSK
jgi:arsenate reductase (glutaredoxin)